MEFNIDGRLIEIEPEVAIVAGFTGRDKEEVQRHVDELVAEGVTAPEEVPSFYPLPASCLTQASRLETLHGATSGEAEIVLLRKGEEMFVTLGSDHTDRRAEAVDIGLSKQVCPKPIASTVWDYAEVADRWDELEVRSWILEGGERRLYQEGRAASLLPPDQLIARLRFAHPPHAFVLLTGTIPALGSVRGADHFWAELVDPATQRSIRLDYAVKVLNVMGVGG
jgi:hypothetical protein